MQCPNCQGQVLKIEVQFQGFVTMSFVDTNQYQLMEPVSLTSQWELDSACVCEECQWMGVVAEALSSWESATWKADAE
jgi:hypothetical protein